MLALRLPSAVERGEGAAVEGDEGRVHELVVEVHVHVCDEPGEAGRVAGGVAGEEDGGVFKDRGAEGAVPGAEEGLGFVALHAVEGCGDAGWLRSRFSFGHREKGILARRLLVSV